MDRERFEDLKEAYALGALPEQETREFDEYLAGHPDLQGEVEDLAQIASLLAVSPPEQRPPRRLRNNLLSTVRAEAARDEAPGPGLFESARERLAAVFTSRSFGFGVAGVVVVALFGWNLVLNGQVGELRNDNSQLQARMQTTSTPANSSANQVYAMSGEGEMQDVKAEVISAKDGKAVLMAENLPAIPEGRTLQIWVIKDGDAMPSGVFEPNGDPVAAVVSHSLDGASTVAVTIEPAGGSSAPTTKPMLAAEL